MAVDSTVAGYLPPEAAPAPLEGEALNNFLQQLVVGITGLSGQLVRPRWQTEPPNIPVSGTAWCALGILARPADKFPSIKHDGAGDGGLGVDRLQRNEELNILCSFYDTGTNGLADYYTALLRDGLAIAQNREVLLNAHMGLVSVGEPTPVPSLLKVRWLYRVDLPLIIRRMIERVYPVRNVLTATAEVVGDGSIEIVNTIDVHS